MRCHLSLCAALLVTALRCDPVAAAEYDVVVYGGTASGVIAAVAAAREGLHVALLEPKRHIGGMVSGGLSSTDVGRSEVISGYTLEYYRNAGTYYGTRPYGSTVAWKLEPHVAESLFQKMANKAKVDVFLQHRLREKDGVTKKGSKITEIFLENGASFSAKVFIDATYEGDLMAFAGVSYIVGREPQSQYGEYSGGVREGSNKKLRGQLVKAFDADGKLLEGVLPGPPSAVGDGDKKTQSYNFRLCLTREPENRVPFTKPARYDPKRYEVLYQTAMAMVEQLGPVPAAEQIFPTRGEIPNKKVDLNTADYIGGNWDYPDGSYARRAEIWQDHVDYIAGYIYFLGNDPRLPKEFRAVIGQWGMAKDEFVDNNHWPTELYVREARRMVGDWVMTQRDVVDELKKPDPVALGTYGLDVHGVQRYADAQGYVEVEGGLQRTEAVRMKHIPYQIPYRALLPKRAEAENLLVPVCVSTSHVVYSTLRMEPQYMMLGHASGVAAKMAIAAGKPVQDVDTRVLSDKLRAQHMILEAQW